MKGEDKKLIRFFEGADKRFIIPLYQRNYDWEIKHCRQLFCDLVKLHEEQRRSHFFGSIVTGRANDYSDDYMIIDGQQRITTISLLLIAMVNAAREGKIYCEDTRKIDKIYKTYLVDEYQDNERKVKLKPIKNDMKAFDALIYQSPEEYLEGSNVTRNYNFFYESLKACKLTLEQVLESIRKLVIIDIRLERDDDPQLIFESLNSTGLDLSEADKIRNYLLMSMKCDGQERCYEMYWNKIEESTEYNPTMFIRDYLTLHTKTISNIDNLYFEFKAFVEKKRLSREETMRDMTEYARYYHIFSKASSPHAKLNKKFKQLATIGSTVGMAFYMPLLKYADEKGLPVDEVYQVFDIIEGYWARRIICNYPTNAMNKTFAVIHHDVLRLMGEETKRGLPEPKYSEVLKYVLLRRQGTGTYPPDTEVSENFKTRQVYRMPIAYRYFLFERMENGDNAEGKWENIIPNMVSGDYTIEHIMPQKLSATWKQQLGPDAERIHEQYLHTFANLTLTGYNSSYGNKTYNEKKRGYEHNGKHVYGFNESHFWLSNYMKKTEVWTEMQLKERQQLLFNRFLHLWPMITTDFIPIQKETDRVPFDEEDGELTGRRITAYSYKDMRHKVSTWKEMLLLLCREIYEDYPDSIRLLCKERYGRLSDSQQNGDWSMFEKGCYVYSSCSTQNKLFILRAIFNRLAIPLSDLEFELTPVEESHSEADSK